MRTFENSDLCDSAVQIVCLNSIASIAVLRKTVGFDQADSNGCLIPEPCFLGYTSTLWGAAIILFEQPLRGLLAFLFEYTEYFFVKTARFHGINTASSMQAIGLQAFDAIKDWMRICPAVVLRHGDSAMLHGTSLETLNL
jgi:hypothetical protein